jgi:hypothetical protein
MSGANLLVLGGTQAAVDTSVYVEDVFSTYLYTGNGSNQTITNNINLSGKDGLIWWKARSGVSSNLFQDTVRGITKVIRSNDTGAETTETTYVTSVSTTGFDVGTSLSVNNTTYATWTFREQAKFFDVVTYTGTGSARSVSHNLGSTPGCIIIKCTSNADSWIVYHRSTGTSKFLYLNTTDAEQTYSWISSVGSTSFTLNDDSSLYNTNGRTYVAYLFAHDAGGFGDAGSDNVITCGSYTGNGSTSGPTVTLNYEPQWIMIKNASTTGSWQIIDNMRGMVVSGNDQRLIANSSSAELSNNYLSPTATGFTLVSDSSEVNGNGNTMIYIAVRRGPMKTPTSGTSVFSPVTRAGNATSNTIVTAGFPVDMVWNGIRDMAGEVPIYFDRLRGNDKILFSASTAAEFTTATVEMSFTNSNSAQTGVTLGTTNNGINGSGVNYVNHFFRRAPGFFDVVCYTGTGSATTISHNLGVVPELMIVKDRNSAGGANWWTYSATIGNTKALILNDTGAATSASSNYWNNTSPTSTQFTAGYYSSTGSSVTYVAYLFASVTGVSKVGSYTGTGTTLQVNCGFTNGSRFVLIKRTDSTGDWYVWDSARGIVAGNDPYLLLNSSAAEVTNTDYVDTYSAGFEISSTAPAAINANGGTFIFLAIA